MYFDAHSDIWTDVTCRRLMGEAHVFRDRHAARLRKGGVEGGIFVIWVDPPHNQDYAKRTQEIMDCIQAEVEEGAPLRIVHTAAEMDAARAAGEFYVFKGIEGMAAMGEDLSWIDRYYDFGCRHAILTWNEANTLGAGALSGKDYGLTPLGKKAAGIIQDKGMLLDVSHLNEAGFWDVARLAKKPFIASHSNAKALCDVPRNLTDDQLRAIRDAGGVVGLNAYHLFIDADRSRQTAARLAEHAAHMIDCIGIDHVGCGFDFFEFLEADTTATMGTAPEDCTIGLEDCTKIHGLFDFFKGMGLRQDELDKLAFGNFHRVIRESIG